MKKPDQVDGKPLVAGTNIVAKGFGKGVMGRAVGGAVGQAAAQARGAKDSASPLQTGDKGYLALTDDELLVMSLGGMMVLRPKDVLLRMARSELANMSMGDAKAFAPLDVTFADGSVWNFEVPRPAFANARELVQVVGKG